VRSSEALYYALSTQCLVTGLFQILSPQNLRDTGIQLNRSHFKFGITVHINPRPDIHVVVETTRRYRYDTAGPCMGAT
jgi:hypothetical protein